MKEYIKPIVVLITAFLLLLILIERSCESPDERYFKLKGQFESYKEETEKEKQKAQKIIQAKEGQIAEKDSQIEKLRISNLDLEEEARDLREEDKAYEERIAELEKLEGQGDLAQMYENMTAQRDQWRDRFFNERAGKEKIAEQRDNWARMYFKEHEKFLAQAEISESYKKHLERETALRKISEELNERSEKRIRKLKIGSEIKTVVIVGTVIIGGYVVVKELRE